MQLFGLNITRAPNPAAIHVKESHPKTGTWVRLGQGGYTLNRDVTGQNLFDTNDRAYKAWLFNPFVKRIVEVWVNYVVGSGLTFTAKDQKVKDAIDAFLMRNKIQRNMKQRGRETYLFGELCGVPNINSITGNVKLGFADPLNISKVHLDPFDGDNPIAVEIKTQDETYFLLLAYTDERGTAADKMPEVYGDDRPTVGAQKLNTIDRKVGRAFFLRFNTVIGAQRGATDLLPILDWCAGLEDLLWATKERTEQQNAIVGVIKIDGATPKQLNDYRNPESPNYIPPPVKYDPSDPSTWAYANEKISFTFSAPEINASEIKIISDVFKDVIQIGSGNPAVVFGQAAEMTYASAQETTSPFYQMMESGQNQFVEFWTDVIAHAIDQKRIFTTELDEVTDFGFEVTAPQIAVDNKKLQVEIAKGLTDLVIAWMTNGLMNPEQSADMIRQIASEVKLPIKELVEQDATPETTKESAARALLKRITEGQE